MKYTWMLMKRSERHRLKENELSTALTEASARLAENKRTFGIVLTVVLLAVIGGGGYWAWTTRTETRAQVLLTDATLVAQSPVEEPTSVNGAKPAQTPGSYATIQARAEAALAKFTEVLNAYPSTKAGIAARYHAGSALMLLGRPAEAVARYREVMERAGTTDFYGRMARLGLIEAQVQAKQFDEAISAAEALANDTTDDTLPRDALLMELGRVYAAAGKKAEARQTFNKVVTDFPQSLYIEEAKQLISAS